MSRPANFAPSPVGRRRFGGAIADGSGRWAALDGSTNRTGRRTADSGCRSEERQVQCNQTGFPRCERQAGNAKAGADRVGGKSEGGSEEVRENASCWETG